MRCIVYAITLFYVCSPQLMAQTNRLNFTWTSGPAVKTATDTLAYGFHGGTDLPQWSRIDLNRDGLEDLVAFDRQGNRWITFLQQNNTWEAAPEYADSLPIVQNWALFRDFDNDGKKDLFAYVSGGMGVWKNNSNGYSLILEWALPGTYLTTNTGSSVSNLYNFSSDIPSISDIDDDGDIDILTFGQRSTIEWHEGLTQDSLNFQMNTTCWGRFEENLASNNLSLNGCQGVQKISSSSGAAHAGSTLLVLDLNADTLRDVLIGDVSFTNLVAAYNGGLIDSAFMTSKDTLFPNISPTNIEYFPAAYYEDVNFDAIPDLIVSPNLNGSINQGNTWLYSNNGTFSNPSFNSLDSSFLVNEMLDIGSGARPTLCDLDFDGDYDLVVGGKGSYLAPGTYQSKLQLFTNIGTNTSPSFELTNSDLANAGFNNLGEDLSPTFGDLDGDLDPDLLIGAQNGFIYYYENSGTILSPSFTYKGALQSIDVGNNSTPSLGDLDGDGDLDLVIGNESGTVAYYKKTGVFPNIFTLEESSWAGIDMSSSSAPSGYSVPVIIYGSDTTLLIGSEDLGVVQKDSVRAIMNGSSSLDVVFDSGVISSNSPEETPFSGSKRNGRMQIILSSDELSAAGSTFGQLTSIGFEIGSNTSTYLTQGFSIGLKHLSDTAQVNFQNQGFQNVYQGIRVLTTGWNDVQFLSPFTWNGEDHIIIEVCFSKNAQTGDVPIIYGLTPFSSVLYGDVSAWNGITKDGCEMPYKNKSNKRPNVRFNLIPTLRDIDTHFKSSGKRLHPAVADLNADGYLDVIVGNMSGGLHYFEGTLFNDINITEAPSIKINPVVYPNPATTEVFIAHQDASKASAALYTVLGKKVGDLVLNERNQIALAPGLYIVVVKDSSNAQVSVHKLIIQ